MKEINVSQLADNMIEAIGKEWMLVTAGTKAYEFIRECDTLTLSFLGEENKAIHKICGSKSGRDTDKIAETGLIPISTENGNITFSQARLTLECRKLYEDDIKPEKFIDKSLDGKWYGNGHGNYHKMIILEVEHIFVK